MRHYIGQNFLTFNKTLCLKILQNLPPCIIAIKTPVFFWYLINRLHGGCCCHQINQWQVVTAANFKIVKIMCWCNFYRTRPFVHLCVIISNYWNLPVRQWQYHHFANQMLIPLIIGIDRNRSVAKHGFRPGRCNRDKFIIYADKSIFEVPHRACLLALFDL